MSKEHILVTGGAGYIGSVLIPALLERGYAVTAFDCLYFGREPLAQAADHPDFRLVEGDVRDLDASLLDGVDAVIHMAALSNDPACELRPKWTFEVNHGATVRLARLCKEQRVQRFIYSSSCSVYGSGSDAWLTEESPLAPVSLYAQTKVEAEKALLAEADAEFHPVCLRKATVFGLSPRMRFDLAINLMTLYGVTQGRIFILGGGQQWRPFVHLRDAVQAYQLCLEAPAEKIAGRVYNVVAVNYRVADLAQEVQRCLGDVQLDRVPEDDDKRSYKVSGERFERELGFKPQVLVEEGVEEVARAIRSGDLGDLSQRRYYTVKTLRHFAEMPAIEGGEPVRSAFLLFAQPSFTEREEQEVIDTLRSGWITTGPRVKRLEEMFCDYLGCKHAIAVSSCTAALHLSLAAIGVGPGDEVITSPITWPSTANVVIHLGATPVFADVERDTLNLDVSQIEARITPRTRAIIPVHLAGQPCDMDAIHEVAAKYNLVVIEDAAHAIGARYNGRKIGTISPFTCFSFYPIKNITTIEGGLVTTDDDELAQMVRILSLHGISKDAWKRYSASGTQHWQLLYPGYKYNMTDVQAAVGLHQLPMLDEFIERRAQYVVKYNEAFADLSAIRPLAQRPNIRHAHHLYVILVQPEQLTIDRDRFMAALKAENIGIGVHFISLHLQPYYRETRGFKPEDYPNANWISQRIISLPLYPGMTEADLHDVITAVRKVARAYQV